MNLPNGRRSLATRLAEAAEFLLQRSALISPERRLGKQRVQSQLRYFDRLRAITPVSTSSEHTSFLYQLNGLKREYLTELQQLAHGLPPVDEKCKLSVVVAAAN